MSEQDPLTEAQKLLLQKFPDLPKDDPLVEFASWNASLEQKVDDFRRHLDVWTTAILKQSDLATQQNQLIVSQNLTLQETAKNNAALGQTLIQFKQGLSQLQLEFRTLKTAIDSQGASWKSLNEKLDDCHFKLKSLEALNALHDEVGQLRTDSNTNRTRSILFGLLLLSVQTMQLFAYQNLSENLGSAIQGVRDRTEWTLTKLERLEKR